MYFLNGVRLFFVRLVVYPDAISTPVGSEYTPSRAWSALRSMELCPSLSMLVMSSVWASISMGYDSIVCF